MGIGVADYIIYRATKEDLSDLKIIGRSDINTYKDTDINSISKYFYYVKAEDAEGNIGPASQVKNTYAGANIAIGRIATADSEVRGIEASKMEVDGDIVKIDLNLELDAENQQAITMSREIISIAERVLNIKLSNVINRLDKFIDSFENSISKQNSMEEIFDVDLVFFNRHIDRF